MLVTLNNVYIYLLMPLQRVKLVETLFQTSMNCIMKSLGPNHVQTASLMTDFAQFYIRMNNRESALDLLEEAYTIYENCYEHQQKIQGSEMIGDVCI